MVARRRPGTAAKLSAGIDMRDVAIRSCLHRTGTGTGAGPTVLRRRRGCGRRKGENDMTSSDLDGRGTRLNPANRFERLHVDLSDVDEEPDASTAPVPTELYRDASRSALAENDSPDLGFRFSLNPYRGCEHGCIYCYARPSHEYLGFSAGLDFE